MEPKQRRTRKSPEDRRAEIAATARAIALEEGLDAVTQRAVAARSSIASALVAHYVESMDALVADSFSEIVAQEIAEVRELVAAEPTATAGLAVLLDAALEPTRQDVTSLWVQAWSLGRRNAALAEAVRLRMDEWLSIIREAIVAGIAAGDVRCDDVDGTALHLLAMIDGLNAHALVHWGPHAAQQSITKRAAEGLLGLDEGALSASPASVADPARR